MLLTLVDEPFDRKGWIFEIKWDGFRAVSDVRDGRVRIISRNQKRLEPYFPSVVEELRTLPFSAVLDGELVILDGEGKADFEKMLRWNRSDHGSLIYYVFDILYLMGHDLRSIPLISRKEILAKVLPDLPHVRIVEHIENKGCALFKLIDQHGVEGMVCKDGKSPYQEGVRGRSWLKVKIKRYQEAVIGGILLTGKDRDEFGGLVLGISLKETACAMLARRIWVYTAQSFPTFSPALSP